MTTKMMMIGMDCLAHLRGGGGELCSRCGGGSCQGTPALIPDHHDIDDDDIDDDKDNDDEVDDVEKSPGIERMETVRGGNDSPLWNL